MVNILFLYSTREGQTLRICERMAQEARQAGQSTQILPLSDKTAPAALAQADVTVVGASVHCGHLPAELYRFASAYRNLLEKRDSAFFCINLTARKPGKDTPEGSVYMRRFLKKSPWRPQRLAVFAGALRYTQYNWLERALIRFIMRLTGGPTDTTRDVEFTDWERVLATARLWCVQQTG